MSADNDRSTLNTTPLSLRQINVDLTGLNDFRAFLRGEIETNLRPAVNRITADHCQGVGFGWRNPGAHVQTARQRYHDTLTASTHTLASYVQAAEIMTEALRLVMDNYHDADILASATAETINAQLSAATRSLFQARLDAEEAARQDHWLTRTEHVQNGLPL